ncbi:MAG: ABC transporter substrate-binding protein [Geminicoccaceae bacterium]
MAGGGTTWNRRQVSGGLAVAGLASLTGVRASTARADEPPPETKTIRLIRDPVFPVLCYAPQYIADEFLTQEGFTDIQYVGKGEEGSEAQTLVRNEADMSAALGVDWIFPIVQGDPIVVLSGLHAGCVELFANADVRTIRDLKGKRLAVHGLGSPERYLLASVASYIGLDPNKDIEWVLAHPLEWGAMLQAGKVDAIAGFPPMNYALHAEKVGHVILNTITDDPWRHYFCCLVAARREYAEQYPVATKRALRALLKANELCTKQPEVAAGWLVEHKQAPDYDTALQILKDIPYVAWRNYDPEDSMRFYALRLREAGLIDQTPEEIIAAGTDWRMYNELKLELKA